MDEDGLEFSFQVVQHLQREDGPTTGMIISGGRLGGQVVHLLLQRRRRVRRSFAEGVDTDGIQDAGNAVAVLVRQVVNEGLNEQRAKLYQKQSVSLPPYSRCPAHVFKQEHSPPRHLRSEILDSELRARIWHAIGSEGRDIDVEDGRLCFRVFGGGGGRNGDSLPDGGELSQVQTRNQHRMRRE